MADQGLALSGGGYRATLFHLGALWRLHELGLLAATKRVTSVSGGSITSAWLGLKWTALYGSGDGGNDDFRTTIADPIIAFCQHTIDGKAGLLGFIPFVSPAKRIARQYRKHLYGDATLQNLPDDNNGPRFIIYATNMQSGVSFRFSRPYMGDYRIGLLDNPDVPLADAVASSSAFPPVLSPMVLKTDPDKWRNPDDSAALYPDPRYRKKIYLADGGVYDNMGLEALTRKDCKKPFDYDPVLVSAAGAPMADKPNPWGERFSKVVQTLRVIGIMSEQERRLRRRMLLDNYVCDDLRGAYWNIASTIASFGLADPITSDSVITQSMKDVETRLKRLPPDVQGHLVNWGYALADTSVRSHLTPGPPGDWAWPVPAYPL